MQKSTSFFIHFSDRTPRPVMASLVFIGVRNASLVMLFPSKTPRRLATNASRMLRQLPRELHPVTHEAREGKGRARGGLRRTLGALKLFGPRVRYDLDSFKASCDVILVNC